MVVSSKGQVVIPAEIRKQMRIGEGDILSAWVEDGRLVITAKRTDPGGSGIVARTAGLLADMEMTGAHYVEDVRRGSGGRP